MTEIIYVDVLIFLNTVVNCFLLLTTGIITKTNAKTFRIIIGSVAGGVFSLTALLPQLNFGLSLLLRIVTGSVLVIITFGFKTPADFIKKFIVLFTVTFLFAGLMTGIWLIFKPAGMIYKNTAFYFDVNFYAVVITTAISYILIYFGLKFFSRKKDPSFIYDVEFSVFGKIFFAKAMLDTGNGLSEIFTGYPVVICTYRLIENRFEDSIDNTFKSGIIDNIDDEKWKKRIRIISCHTVSGSSSLISFRPDIFRILNTDIETDKVYIAISNKQKYINEKFDMLINNNLVER